MSNGKKPHFSEWVWESTEQNIAIPPREPAVPERPALKKPQRPASEEKQQKLPEAAEQLQLWDAESQEPVTTTESEFVQRARELVAVKGEATLYVPFKSYWPNYGHMTGAQSKWYFFWRGEVREGRYPATDLSYIFLHVYELINGVGWDDPLDGYTQLCRIWEAYRDKFKRLDQYMGGWIADFSFVHKLEVPLSLIVARSRGLAGDLAELELMRCLSSAREQLSFAVLTFMSDYDISKSKFYTGEGQEAAELYIPKVVALIDAYVMRKHGQSLMEMFPPGAPVLRERYLFRSAVYDISLYGYSVLVPVVRISKSIPLRSLVTRLFRLTENKLRDLMGFRGRLKGVKLDADMEELVTQYLQREFHKAKQEEKGPAVVIDTEKLERLQADSDVVRTLLTVQDLGYTEEVDATVWPEAEAVDDHDAVLEGSEGNNDGSKIAKAKGYVDEGYGESVKMYEAESYDSDKLYENESNDKSNITGNEHKASVTADFTALEREVNPVSKVASKDEASRTEETAEDSEWVSFAAALTPLQRDAVLALTGDEGWHEVQKLAAANGTMAELLMDEINDIAMDMLGDLLIDGEEIIAEYVPMLSYLKR
ncbi:TerB N-terminal domain-containing protein [Paenibacillus sp. GCM10012306]|uniref:TerB N-terminal domain-containing protein n=1 Tax=Paenibacillus sp. GCM10012306 TaxID=3317342 RepID=UPI00361B15F2